MNADINVKVHNTSRGKSSLKIYMHEHQLGIHIVCPKACNTRCNTHCTVKANIKAISSEIHQLGIASN